MCILVNLLTIVQGIAQIIPGATAAELSIDSSNLLEIVKEEYRVSGYIYNAINASNLPIL